VGGCGGFAGYEQGERALREGRRENIRESVGWGGIEMQTEIEWNFGIRKY
jgi:hypothetical protein